MLMQPGPPLLHGSDAEVVIRGLNARAEVTVTPTSATTTIEIMPSRDGRTRSEFLIEISFRGMLERFPGGCRRRPLLTSPGGTSVPAPGEPGSGNTPVGLRARSHRGFDRFP